jgi:hypothetical protein
LLAERCGLFHGLVVIVRWSRSQLRGTFRWFHGKGVDSTDRCPLEISDAG